MVPGHSTRLALDTNILLDLAAPATVLIELDFAIQNASDKKRQKLSEIVQELMLTKWNVVPLPEPFRVEDAENFGFMLRTRGLLPLKERNDGLIVAECSLEGIGLLATSDGHLHNMDQEGLALAFNDFTPRLPAPVAIFHHTRITNILRRLPDPK